MTFTIRHILSHTTCACSQVDEGIEAMLCCWLQQLQEFGGPEVEKPDLLQLGSVNSLRPYLQASGGNITRHTFFKDPRARYNVSICIKHDVPFNNHAEYTSLSPRLQNSKATSSILYPVLILVTDFNLC